MNKLKQTKGITLIALIITIIVLLILAAVTLAMVMGENGIIRKAQMAKERTNASQEEEKEQLEDIEEQIERFGRAESANLNYSTDEKVVGTWIDGKPLYQKTLVFNQNFAAGANTRVNNNVSNLKEYILITGIAFRKDGRIYKIPSSYYGDASWNLDVNDGNASSLAVQVGSSYTGNNFTITKLYITIQYTKTTD